MPKGNFVVMKTGTHPMKVKLRLFLEWGIQFGTPYEVPEKAQRPVIYANKKSLEDAIIQRKGKQSEKRDGSSDHGTTAATGTKINRKNLLPDTSDLLA